LVPEGTGTTVTWSPITDSNAPWYFYTRFHLGYEEAVVDVVAYEGMGAYREVIDAKAMRRIRPDVEVQLVIEQATVGSAHAIQLGMAGRTLFGF